ncbi:MAG: TrbC/VirB2 family protein [Alphaproteobacteria bacterium]|nr:TrbC/VirB2 family protein [Alphaproteobacteria bacterium]
MKFLKNNICTILAMTFIFSVAMIGDASAATVFDTAISKLSKLFKDTKSVLFVIGGFGLVALAFQAIFGKLKWAWFAALALGLAVVAAAGKVVDYAVSSNDGGTVTSTNYDDSL